MDMGSNPISAISDCMNWVGHSSPGSQVPREEKDHHPHPHQRVAGPGRARSAEKLVQRSYRMQGTLRPISFPCDNFLCEKDARETTSP